MRCRSLSGVFEAELSRVIGAPGVDLSCPSENYHEAAPAYLEVAHLKLVDALDAVRGVELSEGACAPEVELLV